MQSSESEAVMRKQGKRNWMSWVAVAAAYLMIVQALLVGVKSGAMAATGMSGIPGHVLCLTDASQSTETQQPASDSTHTQPCCTIGCHMFGPALSAPPQASAAILYPVEASLCAFDIADDRILCPVAQAPLNARAPPQTI